MANRTDSAAATLGGIFLSLAGVCACVTPVLGQIPPERPYSAVYQTLADPSSPVQTHIMSDGKGHTRSESTVAGQQYVSIMDSTKKECVSLNMQSKTATKVNFDSSAYYDPNYAKSQKPLGSKVVDGHPCHGWQMITGGTQTQTWIGDDIGCTVLVTSNNKPFMRLVKHQPAFVPTPDLFIVPPGFKIVQVPAQAGASASASTSASSSSPASSSSGSIYTGTGSIYGSTKSTYGSSSGSSSSTSSGSTTTSGNGGTGTNTQESYDE